ACNRMRTLEAHNHDHQANQGCHAATNAPVGPTCRDHRSLLLAPWETSRCSTVLCLGAQSYCRAIAKVRRLPDEVCVNTIRALALQGRTLLHELLSRHVRI